MKDVLFIVSYNNSIFKDYYYSIFKDHKSISIFTSKNENDNTSYRVNEFVYIKRYYKLFNFKNWILIVSVFIKYFYKFREKLDWIYFFKFTKYILQYRYQIEELSANYRVIHSHYLLKAETIASSFVTHKHKVLTIWGSDLLKQPSECGFLLFLSKKIIKNFDIIHVPSEYIRNTLIDSGFSHHDIRVIRYYVNCSNNNLQKKEIIREKYGIPNNYTVFFSLRKLFPIYHIECIINIFNKLSERFSNLFLIIGGTGIEESKLQNLSKKLGISNIMFTGYLNEEKYEYFALSDYYIQAPEYDALGITVLEALCFKLPIISTNVGSLSELVNNNFIEIYIDNIDKSFSEIICYLENHEKYLELKDNSYNNFTKINTSLIYFMKNIENMYFNYHK